MNISRTRGVLTAGFLATLEGSAWFGALSMATATRLSIAGGEVAWRPVFEIAAVTAAVHVAAAVGSITTVVATIETAKIAGHGIKASAPSPTRSEPKTMSDLVNAVASVRARGTSASASHSPIVGDSSGNVGPPRP